MRRRSNDPGIRKGVLMATIHEAAPPVGQSFDDLANLRIEKTLAMSAEADDLLADLSRRTGFNEGNVIKLALAMFKAAVDAKEQGKHVGIADTSDALVTELVGF
jgi:hypothetical protein